MNRMLAVALGMVLLSPSLAAGEQSPHERSPGDSPAAESRITGRDIMINGVIPGYAQIRLGSPAQGAVYLAAVPLTVAGLALQTHYLVDVFRDPALERFTTGPDGRWYAIYLEGLSARPDKWEFFSGTLLGLYGTLLFTHSQYDLQARLTSGVPGERPLTPSYVSLSQALLAPWQPRNLFNRDILPVFSLSVLPDLARIERGDLNAYFARDTVPFLTADVSPAVGLALAASSAVLIANANAVWEEIAYRGIQLRASGPVGSSLRFGFAHIPNALVPNVSVGETLWQSAFATMFGLEAASVTLRNGGDFRKAIAWHFWNNVLAFTLDYLLSPDDQVYFGIGVQGRY